MKNTIETPAGCKISKTEIIDGNLIVTYERDLPANAFKIKDRNFEIEFMYLSTKERAEAIFALCQLLELAAYVGGKQFDFNFAFNDENLGLEFHKKYSDLFEKTKKLL